MFGYKQRGIEAEKADNGWYNFLSFALTVEVVLGLKQAPFWGHTISLS